MDNEQRALIFNSALTKADIPTWGRVKAIKEVVDCSYATAQGWCRGSLPTDPVKMLKACDAFNIDLREWVTGEQESRPTLNKDKLVTAVEQSFKIASSTKADLSSHQIADLILMFHKSDSDKVLDRLADIISICK